jgi:hypothetical protein
MNERIERPRGRPIAWLLFALQVPVLCVGLWRGIYPFAALAVSMGCLFAFLAWRGEPARGTAGEKVMWGLIVLSMILFAATALSLAG